jgi:hypothetical protein
MYIHTYIHTHTHSHTHTHTHTHIGTGGTKSSTPPARPRQAKLNRGLSTGPPPCRADLRRCLSAGVRLHGVGRCVGGWVDRYVCIIRIYVCIYIHTYVCIHTSHHTHIRMYIHTHIRMYIHTYTHTYVYIQVTLLH